MKDRKLKKEEKKKKMETKATVPVSKLTASPEASKPTVSSKAASTQGLPGSTPSSPRTPPGTPPEWASKPLSPPPCQDLNQNRYNPIEVAISELKARIARDNPNFDELMELVRNSKLPSEVSQEDLDSDYPDLDMENCEEEETE